MNAIVLSPTYVLTGLVAAGAWFLVLATPCLAGPTPANALLVAETKPGQLDIVDPVSLKVVAKVPVGPDPHEVIASTDGKIAYVSNYMGADGTHHTIARVDLVAQKALSPIDLGAIEAPHGLYFAGGKLFFTAENSKMIGRYDPATEKVDWMMGTGQDGTHLVWVANTLDRIIAPNSGSATVSFIESRDQRVNDPPAPGVKKVWTVTNVPAGRGAEGFDFTPDGKQLWVVNRQDATLTVIDLATKTPQATIPISSKGLNRLMFSPGKYALITSVEVGPNLPNLVVLDVASRKEIKQVSLGMGVGPMLQDPANNARVFLAPLNVDKVLVFDLKSMSVMGEITSVINPNGIAWAARKN